MISLHIEPRRVMTWEAFQAEKPPFSVALDGFVSDATKRNPIGPYANFDHHTLVDRISTRSTAEQVHIEVNLDVFSTFRNSNGEPHMNIYVNDPDEDTTLATWLLFNHERVRGNAEPLINKLVHCSGFLDCTAGSFPFGDLELLRKMEWIFEPYKKVRKTGALSTIDETLMRSVFEAVMGRITEYSLGKAGAVPINTFYKVVGGGPGWSMVHEASTSARALMFNSGVTAFVSCLNAPGRFVIGRKSTWIPFPLEDIYRGLNDAEGAEVWGGSNTIGGSLRGDGSKLSKDQITEVINRIVTPIV